jgi:hypothetical protein
VRLPQLLIVAAVTVIVFGVRRVRLKGERYSGNTMQALLIWFVLVLSGLAIWLWARSVSN